MEVPLQRRDGFLLVNIMQGWIKLYRKIQEDEIWDDDEPFDKRSAWIDLLLMANHKDKKCIFNGQVITVKAGQRITSIRNLAERWHWSTGRVIRYLKLLEELNKIERKSDKNKTLVTIVNYGFYQSCRNSDGDSDEYSDGYTDDTVTDTVTDTKQEIKNEKNDKNIKSSKEKPICNIIPPDVEWVRTYCKERNNGIDPQKFFDFYESKGWKVGKEKMKNWQACVRTWENRDKKEQKKNPGFQQTKYDFDALNKMINGD